MSVVIETTIGSLTVDLFVEQRPRTCTNFLKLCKLKYYNFCPFHNITKDFIAQTGELIHNARQGGESIFYFLYGENGRFFEPESKVKLKHDHFGTLSMVTTVDKLCGSQFIFTLNDKLDYLDDVHTVFGRVVEGFHVLQELNEILCDKDNRPYRDVLITHTVILHDPFDNPPGLRFPSESPLPSDELLNSDTIYLREEYDKNEGKTKEEIEEEIKEKEAKSKAIVLEMVGDLPHADVAPPDNVLFVCKLNPVTRSEDLEVIFSRFGKISECEVICDAKTKESLQYAFIEFEKPEDCEKAYFKMDNVLIDDRRIHVDFSQSVSKYKWNRNDKSNGLKYSESNTRNETRRQVRTSRSNSVDSATGLAHYHRHTIDSHKRRRSSNKDFRHKEPDLRHQSRRSKLSLQKSKDSRSTHRRHSPKDDRKDRKRFEQREDERGAYSHRSQYSPECSRRRSRSRSFPKTGSYNGHKSSRGHLSGSTERGRRRRSRSNSKPSRR